MLSGEVADWTNLQTQTKPSALGFQLPFIFSLASTSLAGGKLLATSQKSLNNKKANAHRHALPMHVSTPLCLISVGIMRGNYVSLLALEVLRRKGGLRC